MDYLSYEEPTDENLTTLYNGYHLNKVFQSNSGGSSGNLDPEDENDFEAILAEHNEFGLWTSSGDWDSHIRQHPNYDSFPWTASNLQATIIGSDNVITDTAAGNIDLRRMVAAGNIVPSDNLSLLFTGSDIGYETTYTNFTLINHSFIPAAQVLFTSPESSDVDGDGASEYVGLMGFIGSTDGRWATDGEWNNGELSPLREGSSYMEIRQLLLREAISQYTTSKQPRLGSIFRESLQGTVRAIMEEFPSLTEEEAYENFTTRDFMRWGAMGIAAQPLPIHISYKPSGDVAGDVPEPQIYITSDELREELYDRYSIPVLEVPANTGTGNVTIVLENILDTFDSGGQVAERGSKILIAP